MYVNGHHPSHTDVQVGYGKALLILKSANKQCPREQSALCVSLLVCNPLQVLSAILNSSNHSACLQLRGVVPANCCFCFRLAASLNPDPRPDVPNPSVTERRLRG